MGKIVANRFQGGDAGNFTVAPTGIASFPLGPPTFTTAASFPDMGTTSYSTTSGLGISTSTTPSEAISKIDTWLDAYILDAPPALTEGETIDGVQFISVSWTNPVQKKLAFITNTYVPQINAIKADIVPSANNTDQTWSHSNKWTVTLETVTTKPTVTTLKIILDYSSGTSGLSAGVYSFYGTTTSTRIIAGTSYDIRVYATNQATDAGEKTIRYATFLNHATLLAGTPNAPTGVSVDSITTSSAITRWTAPSDRDTTSDATPFLIQYQVNITSGSSIRYGGSYGTATTPQQGSATAGSDATTNQTLTGLNPGQTYAVTVQGKNALNSAYGSSSSPEVTFTTSNPSAPSYPSASLTLSNQNSLVYNTSTPGGYTLDGSVSVSPILKYATITSTPPQTSTFSGIRINQTVADTSATVGTVQAFAGTSGSPNSVTVTFVGFGQTFSQGGNNDNLSVRLNVSSEGDNYTGSSTGFWKKATVYASAINASTHYRASNSQYAMQLAFTSGSNTVVTNSLGFYVDELNANAAVTACGITGIGTTISYVTGVPTLTSASTFNFQCTINNLAYQFLRTDLRHFEAVLQTSGGASLCGTLTVTKNSINGSTHSYFSPPEQSYGTSASKFNDAGTTLTINPGSIQFNTFTLTFSAASNVFDENLRLQIVPYNLQGAGSTTQAAGLLDTSTGTTKPIRIDTKSITTLASASGTLMTCGTGQFPSSGFTSTFDHTVSIVGTDQLQMVAGLWVTPAYTGYSNYSNFYFPSVTGPDYSSIVSSTDYRYVNYRFTSLKTSGTYDSITITFTSSGFTLTPASDAANFRLYVKIVGTSTTVWVSATASINASGYGAITTDGQGAMDNSAASVGSIKVFVPTGTVASATIYLRFGLQLNTSQSLGTITCVAN